MKDEFAATEIRRAIGSARHFDKRCVSVALFGRTDWSSDRRRRRMSDAAMPCGVLPGIQDALMFLREVGDYQWLLADRGHAFSGCSVEQLSRILATRHGNSWSRALKSNSEWPKGNGFATTKGE